MFIQTQYLFIQGLNFNNYNFIYGLGKDQHCTSISLCFLMRADIFQGWQIHMSQKHWFQPGKLQLISKLFPDREFISRSGTANRLVVGHGP